MRARQVFEYTLTELNKRKAPSLLLEDFIYFFNKSINQYINRMYSTYEINQQRTDDIRVLKSSVALIPYLSTEWSSSNLLNNSYQVNLPDDYLHILNCIVEYDVVRNYKCYPENTKYQHGAKKMTADMIPNILNNFYFKPSYKNPYFYINNITTDISYPTQDNLVWLESSTNNATPFDEGNTYSKDDIIYQQENVLSTIRHYYKALKEVPTDTYPGVMTQTGETTPSYFDTSHWRYLGTSVEITKEKYIRYGNSTKVKMEIRYGKDNTIFQPSKIYIDYIKTPQFVTLLQDEIDEIEDNSQILEFPDYVCQEIINELVKLVMENTSDPRLQSHIPINQSIITPGQERTR